MSEALEALDFSDVDIPSKKPAVYVRVSSKDQNVTAQIHELIKWLLNYKAASDETRAAIRDDKKELRRWMDEAATWYIDEGKSGDRIHDRPAFNAMQRAIHNGQHDTVIVWKIDRLSRKLSHGITCLSDWLERGVHFISTTQAVDLKGAMGKMIAAVLLGVAEMEQETRRERQRAGIEAAKRSQKDFYKKVVAKGKAKRAAVVKKKQGDKPDRARELKEQGYSLGEIAKHLGVGKTTIHRWLKSYAEPQTDRHE